MLGWQMKSAISRLLGGWLCTNVEVPKEASLDADAGERQGNA
jgi:hypothetical protein